MEMLQTKSAANIDRVALDELKEIMGEDFSLLLDTFFEDSDRKCKELEDALGRRDYEQLRLLAHSFKGSSSNLYANGLKQLCYQLEQSAIAERIEDLRNLLARVRAEYSAVKAQLLAYAS